MAFKEDWSFLDKISMGAVGTRKVIELLNAAGHDIIELERYCTSNKIWATKIKRLRIPDLVCLKCGRRIESRAKSKLGIIMSDSPKNEDRRWFSGLRDEDLVAFINCTKTDGEWVASNVLNLFKIGELKQSEEESKLGPPKSASEGAEQDRTWKGYVPGFSCTVEEINDTHVKLLKDTGGRYSKKIPEGHVVYVRQGDHIQENTRIIHSVVPSMYTVRCDHRNFNFIDDLHSTVKETQYVAVKALGFLSSIAKKSIPELRKLLNAHDLDVRTRLEVYSSLARLGESVWTDIENFFFAQAGDDMKMESIFILGELINYSEAQCLLRKISQNNTCSGEIKAAALWSMTREGSLIQTILDFIDDNDEIVASHSIAILEQQMSPELMNSLFDIMQQDGKKAAAGARLISNCHNIDDRAVMIKYINTENDLLKSWLLYAIGLAGSERFGRLLDELDPNVEQTKNKLALLWVNQKDYLSKDMIDSIEFLKLQR